jgi:uncharacterized membrane protein
MMRCLGRIIAFVILLVLVAFLPFAVWLVAFWEIDTNPATFQKTYNDRIAERFAPIILPSFAESLKNKQTANEYSLFIAVVDNTDSTRWEEISQEVIKPEWLKDEAETNILRFLKYLNGDTEDFTLVVNVQLVRNELTRGGAERLTDALMREVNTWEACQAEQEGQFSRFMAGEATIMPVCRPSDNQMILLRTNLLTAIQQMTAQLPEDGIYDIRTEAIAQGEITEEEYRVSVRELRRNFILFDRMIFAIFLIPLALFGLIVVFAVRSWKEFFLWAGLPLVIGGLFNVMPLFPWLYSTSQPVEIIDDSTLTVLGAMAGMEVMRALAGEITIPIIFTTFAMIVVGFIFLILAALLGSPTESTQQYYYVPTTGSSPIPIPTPITPTPTPTPTPASPSTRRREGRAKSHSQAITPPPSKIENLPDDKTISTPPPDQVSSKGKETPASSVSALSDPEANTFVEENRFVPKNNLALDDVETEDNTP